MIIITLRITSKYINKLFLFYAILFTTNLFAQYNAVVTDYSTTIKYNGTELIKEYSKTIQINNKRSNWIADVSISHGNNEGIEILEAIIIDASGEVVRKLKKKEISTRSDISYGSFYEDRFIKGFSLKWNSYPYQIKYTYQRTLEQFLYITYWNPIFHHNIPTINASLSVELPNDYEVAINDSDVFDKKVEALEKSTITTWKITGQKMQKGVKLAPPVQEFLPLVKIIPKHFTYGISGMMDSWANFGNWQAKMNEGLDVLPFSEIIKIDELVKGITDKKEIIKRLYYYMQDNTRYIYVGIDVGGLKPHPASYVCKNKYGDCKALTNYMKAMLKYGN